MSDDEEKRSPELQVRDGGLPSRGKARELLKGTFLDIDSDNFMGSGLSFVEWSRTADILRYERWLANQSRDEKRRRLKYLIALCAEQERIVAQDRSATGLSEMVIEYLIEGDWNGVNSMTKTLRFEDDSHRWRDLMANRFAKFVRIAEEAYETRPKVFCPQCRRPAPKDYLKPDEKGRHECPWCDILHDVDGNFVEKSKAHLSAVEDSDG